MKKERTLLWILLGLAATAGLGRTAAKGLGAQGVEVPFELHKDAILVQAKVNGKGPFTMMLDTGVDPSVVDLATAREIGLAVDATGHQGSGSGTGTNLAHATKLPLLELGGLKAREVDALALDLSKTSAALGKPLRGVLGYSLLKDRVVQIDYPRHVARFYAKAPRPAGRPNGAKVATLAFRYEDDILLEGVSVNGHAILVNLDTGSNGGFQLTPAAVARLGLEAEAARAPVHHSVGFNGSTENREGTVRNVTLGGISIDRPKAVFYGKGTGRDDAVWGLRIGNAFLKNFVVTVDYPRHLVTLERP